MTTKHDCEQLLTDENNKLRAVLQRVRHWGSPMIRGYIDGALGRKYNPMGDDNDGAVVAPSKEADLETVNRTLGEVVRKQEEEIKELRATLLVAAGALKVAGYHESAERCMDTWRKRIT